MTFRTTPARETQDRYLPCSPEWVEGVCLWVPNLLRVKRLREASHWVAEDRPREVNALLLDFLGNPLAALPR